MLGLIILTLRYHKKEWKMNYKQFKQIIISIIIIVFLVWVAYDLYMQDIMHNMTCSELWDYGQEISDSGTATRHSHIVAHLVTDCEVYLR